jgi:hypothetical protein
MRGACHPPMREEGGKRKGILYKRIKWMTEPKNKREGIDTCGQSISDINAWDAPTSSLQKVLVSTRTISYNR